MKRLIGRRDLEDALKKLDKLTHEEARMATAQVLKAAQTVGDGTQSIFSQFPRKRFDPDPSRRKRNQAFVISYRYLF